LSRPPDGNWFVASGQRGKQFVDPTIVEYTFEAGGSAQLVRRNLERLMQSKE